MLLRPLLLLAAGGQVLDEHSDALLLYEELLIATELLQHGLPVLGQAMSPAVLFGLVGRLDLFTDVRVLGQSHHQLCAEEREHLVLLVKGHDFEDVALHEVELTKDLVHLRVKVAVLGEVPIQVAETVLTVLMLDEHLNTIQLFRLTHALDCK